MATDPVHKSRGGQPGRSGPPGNLNAARHGLKSWLRRRALPLNKRHVATFVTRYEDGLTACKGGPEHVSEVQTALIRNAGRSLGAQMLILEEAASKGFVRPVDGTWDLSPGFSRLIGFLNAERQALAVLGVSRESRPVGPDLTTLLAEAAADGEDGDGG